MWPHKGLAMDRKASQELVVEGEVAGSERPMLTVRSEIRPYRVLYIVVCPIPSSLHKSQSRQLFVTANKS